MKRRALILASICLLLTCTVLSDTAWALTPYFRYCNVKSSNTSAGMTTLVTAEIHHPTGSVPDDIASVIVEGPGGFSTTMTWESYDPNLKVFSKTLPGTPAVGQYTFTVIDFNGEWATSSYYHVTAAQLPVADPSTFRAFGNMTYPTLTWSDFSNYNGSLLFKVTVLDSESKPVWTSGLMGVTSVTLPSSNPVLTLNETYTWTVTAVDSIRLETVDNQSVSDPVTLSSAAGRLGFGYARVYKIDQPSGAGTFSYFNAQVFPALTTGSSMAVSGPGGFSHSFQAGECSNSGTFSSTCNYSSSGNAVDGIYTFTVTSSNGNSAKSYHYFKGASVPRADETTFRVCTEPPGFNCSGANNCTRLAWSAPAQASPYAPLYYSVYVFAANDPTEKTVWSSQGMGGPSCVVPSTALQPGTSYQWRLYVQDLRWPYIPNNLARSNKLDLVVDDSKPNFYWGAGADIRTSPSGIFTTVFSYVNDPSSGGAGMSDSMTLQVEGPNGLSYTFDRTADFIPDLWQPGYQYWKSFSGIPSDGILTFTLTYPGGVLVTHDALRNGSQQVPLADDTTFQVTTDVSGEPTAPTVSWSAIYGYPGHIYYRLKIVNDDNVSVYYSSREPYTSQTVPAGVLQPGVPYRCRVEAFDDPNGYVMNNRSSSQYIDLQLTQNTAPGKPVDVQAAPGNGSAAVSFKSPADGGSPITEYTVSSIPEGKTATGTASPIIVPGLTNGTAYIFTVTATNALGTGLPSDESNRVTPSATCAAQLAGKWRVGALVTGGSQPWWDRVSMTINPEGTVTGHETDSEASEWDSTGTLWSFPYGLWLRNDTKPNPTTLCQMDVDATVLACTQTWPGDASTNLIVATKQATTPAPAYSLANLTGTWRANILTSYPTPSWKRLSYTVDTKGNFTGTATGSETTETANISGTLAISAEGKVSCVSDNCIGTTYQYFLDAGKTITQGVGTDGDYGIWVAEKMGTSYKTADLSGAWEVNLLRTSPDPSAPDGLWVRIHLQVDSKGAFTSFMTDSNGGEQSGAGQLSIASNGVVTCSTCDDSGTWQAVLDAGKTTIVGTVSHGSGARQLFIGTKKPAAPPTLSISPPSVASTKTGPVTYTVTYSGATSITLSPDDILLEKTGTANGTVAVSGTGNTTRTVTLSSITGNGTLGISIGSWTASNSAGPCSEAGPSATFIVASPPTLSISNPSAPSTVNGPITYTVTYSAADTVTLSNADITLNHSGSAMGTVAISGTGNTTRTVTISSITGTGTLGISIASGSASNLSGKSAGFGPSATFNVVDSPPAISISAPSLAATTAGPVGYTVTYNNADSITLSPAAVVLEKTGTADAGSIVVSGSGNTRTVTVSSITGDGTLGISIAPGTASNIAGSSAASGPSALFAVGNTLPSVVIGAPSSTLTQKGPVTYTLTYTGANSISLANAQVTLQKTGTAKGTVAVSGTGNTTRTVTISAITGDGTLGISIAAGTASNIAGPCGAAGPSETFTVVNTVPKIVIGPPSMNPASKGPVTFTVTYTGADTITLSDTDVTLSKTKTANGMVSISGTGNTTRTVTVSSISGDGTLAIKIGPKTASNIAGSCGGAGPSAAFTVINTLPQVSIAAPSRTSTHQGPITYKVTYSGAANVTLSAADIILNKTGTADATSISVEGTGNTTRTVTLSTITGDGSLGISIAAGSASNVAGQTIEAGPSKTFLVANTPPTVTISDPSVPRTSKGPITYTLVVSGATSMATNPKITLNKTGTATGTIKVSVAGDNSRTVTISSIKGDGTLGITVPAGAASNVDIKNAQTGPSGTFTVINSAPKLVISSPSVPAASTGPVMYTVTYTGADNITLSPANITLNKTGSANAATIEVAGDGSTRIVTMSSIAGDGTLGISIAAGTASNIAGTSIAAGPSGTFKVVNTLPTLSISPPSLTSTKTGPVKYTVKYTGADSVSLSPANISLNSTGSASGSVSVSGSGNMTRTVTISSVTGNGTLGISIAAGTASNIAGPSAAAGPSGTFNVTNDVGKIYENTARSGDVRTSETWRGVIDVTGDVTVYAPAVLTIEPGTTVRFAARSDDQSAGGDVPITDTNFPNDPAVAPKDMGAIVVWDGTLYAVGTPDKEITFTSSSSTPDASDWHALLYYNANGRMNIQYAAIKYGYYGIAFAATVTNDRVTVKNNRIQNIVACGICCAPEISVNLTIANNNISYCGHEAIDTHHMSNVVIESNNIHHSWNGVIVMNNEPIIRNNEFAYNGSAIYTSDAGLLSKTTGNVYIGNLYHNCSSVNGPILCPDEY